MGLLDRYVRPDIEDAMTAARAVAVVGARQVGKSTLVEVIARETLGVTTTTLDADLARQFATADPDGFLASLPRPAVIDEVQRVPELLLAIKRRVDRDSRPGQFLLTGSVDLRVTPGVVDALPGRIEYVELWPFAEAELHGAKTSFLDRLLVVTPPRVTGAPTGVGAYAERIEAGGFPGARELSARRREGFFASYLDAVVGRDVPGVAVVRHPRAMEPLLGLLAARSGGLVRMAPLGADLGLDAKTVGAYISVLEQIFLVARLPPWFTNLSQRVLKAPRIHVADSGLHCHLVGADRDRLGREPELAGPILESFVFNELNRQRGWSRKRPRLHTFRNYAGDEVDIVVEWSSGEVAGVEVKSAVGPGWSAFAGLRHLRDRLGERFVCGVVLHPGETTMPAGDRLWAVPISALWV